jgi:ADP-ribose pyrophosphatase
MEIIKRIKRELVSKGSIIDYYKDTIEISDSKKARFDFIYHKGASAMIPVDSDGQIIMVRQYRNAIDSYSLEIPAGSINEGEDNMFCAIRECEEEAGYKPGKVVHLIDLYTTVAFSNEKICIYYGEELVKTKQNLDDDEFVSVEKHPLGELVEMIYDGRIMDAKTIAGLLAYKNIKGI